MDFGTAAAVPPVPSKLNNKYSAPKERVRLTNVNLLTIGYVLQIKEHRSP